MRMIDIYRGILVISSFLANLTGAQSKEYPPYSGWYNNRGNPAAGTIDSIITRRLPPTYEDGVYFPSRKTSNPRDVSNMVMSGSSGLPSENNKTVLFYFFGEHVMQEIADAEEPGCPPEFFNIQIPSGDPYFDSNDGGNMQMPYQRSRYQTSNSGYSPNHPREQLNAVTSYLDGSAIYGHGRAWTNQLRLLKKNCPNRPSNHIYENQFGKDCSGELTSLFDEGKFPALNSRGIPLSNPVPPTYKSPSSAKRFYGVGGRNINENPFLLSVAITWFRHHNWLARQLGKENPDWSDERVFSEARIRNVATYQNTVMYEWLPVLLGEPICNVNSSCDGIPVYTGYNPGTSVAINDIFQAAAKHYIRTLAPPGVFVESLYNSSSTGCLYQADSTDSSSSWTPETQRVCNSYWIADEIFNSINVDDVIMGMASQIAELEDHVINDDLRNFFHGPLQFSRRDLVALIIQQGRDHGLADYNTAREELGFPRRDTWNEINPALFNETTQLETNLMSLYGSLDNLDIFVGGMLETSHGRPGELFRAVIRDQFIRLRDGDRFWFENQRNGLLNQTEIFQIRQLSFRDVILRTNPHINGSKQLQDDLFFWNVTGDSKLSCPQPYQIGSDAHIWTTSCTPLQTYDYFQSSEISYAIVLLFIGLFVILTIVCMYLLGRRKRKLVETLNKGIAKKKKMTLKKSGMSVTIATEILGDKKKHQIQVCFVPDGTIQIKSANGNRTVRSIHMNGETSARIFMSASSNSMILKSEAASYDLVLNLPDEEAFSDFMSTLKSFMESHSVTYEVSDVGSERLLLQEANTKEKRDATLRKFFKTALAQSVKIDADDNREGLERGKSNKFVNTRINKEEFAEYLKLKPNSSFVEQIFNIADSDEDGFVSFREFLNIMVLFTKGSAEDKTKLMFNMYDLDKSGDLTVEEFKMMLKSMMDIVNTSIDPDQLDHLVVDMMSSHGLGNKQSLTLSDFQKIMGKYTKDLNEASLVVPGERGQTKGKQEAAKPAPKNPKTPEEQKSSQDQNSPAQRPHRFDKKVTKLRKAQMSMKRHIDRNESDKALRRRHTHRVTSIPVVQEQKSHNRVMKLWIAFVNWNEHYANHIFCLTLYICITICVFLQAFNAVTSNQPSGLARIGGQWMAIARSSAAALMFNFSCLLLTMSRNTITLLRETVLHRFIPFDAAISMHKIVAWMALFFTCLHVVAHGINFYSVSTQSPADLLCLFRDYWFPSDYLPTFVFWCLQTITGVTGVILTLIIIVMYVFASNFSRRAIFNWFQWTHKFGYLSLYFFSVLHGSGMLISPPRFYLFFLGPATLYTLDKLYSLSRKKAQISVVKAELLPSDVTHLEFKRPANFDYKAGQWVRIACLAQSPSEYHPFTLSSAPHEETLKLHIRAVGPWTINLRSIYNPEVLRDSPYPKLYLDGPFGEGHQDWYKYEVSVLVGGGIGVTPFASILKDLVNTTQSGANVTCKNVYFIWVTRDQKQYEWLTDIIKEVESKDEKMILNTHIFITQFPQKFDLRTTMLYICEQHFQKIAGKSLFTGLRAITHFGRPNFQHFFTSLSEEHNKVKTFGVFSCGPPAMTGGVEKACTKLNKYEGPTYSHHFENF